MHIGERDVGLPHGTLCDLASHDLRVKTRRALFDEEAANVAIVIACPDNRNVGKGGVANPALGSIDDILVSCAMSARLQRHCIGAMIRLGQGESADLLQSCHLRPPAPPL